MKKLRYKIKKLPRKDLVKAHVLKKKYVGRTPFSLFEKQYEKYPDLFIGCYDRGKLIGMVSGTIRKKVVILTAIAVEERYWRRGIGSNMLKFFENQARKLGIKKISLGAGGEIEKFYIKNNYKPNFLLVQVSLTNLPRNYKKMGYKIVKEKNYRNVKWLYIQVRKYEPKVKERIKKKFNASQVIYIFEKEV